MRHTLKLAKKGKVAFAVLALAVLAGAAPFVWGRSERILPGVSAGGESLSGKNREETEEWIAGKNEVLRQEQLVLVRGDLEEKISFSDLKVHYTEDNADRLLFLGREGGLLREWADRWMILIRGKDSALHAEYEEDVLQKKIDGLEKKYGQSPHNALPAFHQDGSVTFSAGRPYLKIEKEKLLSMLRERLSEGKSGTVEIPVTEEKFPDMTADEAKQVNRILAQYTTEFYPEENRSHNIRISAEAISGCYIKPGDMFSYNQATGSRSKEKGYKEAPVIVNGKLEPGTGGGVCQVSTTLFNAVMLAGLEVTSRSSHFSPVSYVPEGRDATVAEGIIDFCFRNDLKHGVYIYAVYVPGAVTIYILGNEEDVPSFVSIREEKNETVPFREVVKTDPSQKEEKKIEEGAEGRIVRISQNIQWKDGRTWHDTFDSDYEPTDRVITYRKMPETAANEKKASDKKDA